MLLLHVVTSLGLWVTPIIKIISYLAKAQTPISIAIHTYARIRHRQLIFSLHEQCHVTISNNFQHRVKAVFVMSPLLLSNREHASLCQYLHK